MESARMLNKFEAAELLGVHDQVICRWAQSGKLPGEMIKQPGKAGKAPWRFREADVIALKEARKTPAGEGWISLQEAADRLDIGVNWLRQLARDGRIEAKLVKGRASDGKCRAWWFNRASVEAFAVNPRPEPALNRLYVTYEEAATLLGRSYARVQDLCSLGILKPVNYHDLPREERVYRCKHYLERAAVQALLDAGAMGYQPRPEVQLDLPEGEWGYLGALIDGEGHIGIQRHGSCWTIKVCVVNTHIPAMQEIHRMCGGHITYRRAAKAGGRNQASWGVESDSALAVLRAALPWMKMKREQAEIAIQLQERIRSHRYAWWDPIPAEEAEWREEQKQKISALNHRGFEFPSAEAVPEYTD